MPAPVVLINVFEVSSGQEHEFVEWWKQSSEVLKLEPGFIDAKLHKSLKPDSRFQFVNIAHWETEEALNRARTRNKDILQSLTVGKGNPATYAVAEQYG